MDSVISVVILRLRLSSDVPFWKSVAAAHAQINSHVLHRTRRVTRRHMDFLLDSRL